MRLGTILLKNSLVLQQLSSYLAQTSPDVTIRVQAEGDLGAIRIFCQPMEKSDFGLETVPNGSPSRQTITRGMLCIRRLSLGITSSYLPTHMVLVVWSFVEQVCSSENTTRLKSRDLRSQ